MKRKTYLALFLAAAGLMIMLLVMTIGAQGTDNVGFYEGDPGDAPPAPSGAGNGTDEPMDYWMHLPVVAKAPRLGIGASDFIFYENFDGDWPGWTKNANTINCKENCDEWEWNKSWEDDYTGDGDARLNCRMESPALAYMESDYQCYTELQSPHFDASACSGVMLYTDENYRFQTDDHDSDCSDSSGDIEVWSTKFGKVTDHQAYDDSGGFNIGLVYDISKWAAGEESVQIVFKGYGYLGGTRDITNMCWPNTYSFQTFWRVDEVRVRCFNAQPDGTIALPNKEPIGRGVYNANGDGQTITSYIDPGETAVYEIQWWNDGDYDSDDFVITGSGDDPYNWTVRYYDAWSPEGTHIDITSEVTGDGWLVKNMTGGQESMFVEITAPSPAQYPLYLDTLVKATSVRDPSKVDAVMAVTTILPAPVWLSVEIGSINEGASGRVTSYPAGIDCPDNCQEKYYPGDQVTLTAHPDPGYVFHYWTSEYGACDSYEPSITVTMDADKTCEAYFSRPVIVTPDAGPGGTITPSEPTKVLIGSETFWQVTPDAGYQIADVSITHGKTTACWLVSTTDPNTYRIEVPDHPYAWECTLSATFNSQAAKTDD